MQVLRAHPETRLPSTTTAYPPCANSIAGTEAFASMAEGGARSASCAFDLVVFVGDDVNPPTLDVGRHRVARSMVEGGWHG